MAMNCFCLTKTSFKNIFNMLANIALTKAPDTRLLLDPRMSLVSIPNYFSTVAPHLPLWRPNTLCNLPFMSLSSIKKTNKPKPIMPAHAKKPTKTFWKSIKTPLSLSSAALPNVFGALISSADCRGGGGCYRCANCSKAGRQALPG